MTKYSVIDLAECKRSLEDYEAHVKAGVGKIEALLIIKDEIGVDTIIELMGQGLIKLSRR